MKESNQFRRDESDQLVQEISKREATSEAIQEINQFRRDQRDQPVQRRSKRLISSDEITSEETVEPVELVHIK
jgi:hypothetical protein